MNTLIELTIKNIAYNKIKYHENLSALLLRKYKMYRLHYIKINKDLIEIYVYNNNKLKHYEKCKMKLEFWVIGAPTYQISLELWSFLKYNNPNYLYINQRTDYLNKSYKNTKVWIPYYSLNNYKEKLNGKYYMKKKLLPRRKKIIERDELAEGLEILTEACFDLLD